MSQSSSQLSQLSSQVSSDNVSSNSSNKYSDDSEFQNTPSIPVPYSPGSGKVNSQLISPLKERFVLKSLKQNRSNKESYEIFKVISSGGFGTAYLVQKNSVQYILKEIPFNKFTDDVLATMEESLLSLPKNAFGVQELIDSLQTLPSINFKNHNNLISANLEVNALKYIKSNGCRKDILCYVDHFIDYKAETICIVTDKFPLEGPPAPTLEKFMSNTVITLNTFLTIMQNILSAFSYLHSINVFHNDIKPSNILIDPRDNYSIHVIDFGSACMERYCFGSISEGFLHPQSPSITTDYGRKTTKNLDVYGLGIVLSQLAEHVKGNETLSTPFLNILNIIRQMKNVDINDTDLTLQIIYDQIKPPEITTSVISKLVRRNAKKALNEFRA